MLVKNVESEFRDRVVGKIREKSDCSVLAYAIATGTEYKFAHAELFLAGRRKRQRFRVSRFYTECFGEPKKVPQGWTVEKYLTLIAHEGTWIFFIRGHVFCVKDGVIHDFSPERNLNKRLITCWRVK